MLGQSRYQELMRVRTNAIANSTHSARYWQHLTPVLVEDSELGSMLSHVTARTEEGGVVQRAPIMDRIGWWQAHAANEGFPLLAKAAVKLLVCHATSCAT
jgi:hypothetical protein